MTFMTAALALFRALASVLRRAAPSERRFCGCCARTVRRLTPAQCAGMGSGLLSRCGCGGVLWLATDRPAERNEEAL
jgi:hypothetical protein